MNELLREKDVLEQKVESLQERLKVQDKKIKEVGQKNRDLEQQKYQAILHSHGAAPFVVVCLLGGSII